MRYAVLRASNPGRHFAVDRAGAVTLARSLDRETAQTHGLVVVASDLGRPSRQTSATVMVRPRRPTVW